MLKYLTLIKVSVVSLALIIYPSFFNPTGYSAWVVFVIAAGSVAYFILKREEVNRTTPFRVSKTSYGQTLEGKDREFFEVNLKKLSNILPQLEYEILDYSIEIKGSVETGFDIELNFWDGEIILESEYIHEHIEYFEGYRTKSEAFLEVLMNVVALLSDRERIRVTSRDDSPINMYRETLVDGNWKGYSSIGFFRVPSFTKKKTEYFNNSVLSGDEDHERIRHFFNSLEVRV